MSFLAVFPPHQVILEISLKQFGSLLIFVESSVRREFIETADPCLGTLFLLHDLSHSVGQRCRGFKHVTHEIIGLPSFFKPLNPFAGTILEDDGASPPK